MSWCFSFILKIENPCVSQCGACCCCDDSEHRTLSVINWSVSRSIFSQEKYYPEKYRVMAVTSQNVSPILRNDAKTCHVAQHDKFVNYLFNFCSDSSFGTITKSVQGSRFDWKRNGEIERAVRSFIRLPSDTRSGVRVCWRFCEREFSG